VSTAVTVRIEFSSTSKDTTIFGTPALAGGTCKLNLPSK
jgi:hypothetical protein